MMGGEGYVGNVQGLSRGRHRALSPVCHGLVDHQPGHGEATDHHRQPEQPGELPRSRNVDQAMDRRGFKKLFELVHT